MDPRPRPKYDPRIEQRYAALLDSLAGVMGGAPDSINVAPYWNTRGVTRGNVVSVRSPNDEDALFHELGHFWSMQRAPVSAELADSLKFDPYRTQGAERLADILGKALKTRTNRASPDKETDLLFRLLGRAAERDRQ